jgi:hypothetical protein
MHATYYIIRFTDSDDTLGRWDITSPYGRVPASYAACFESRDKAERISALFPGSVVAIKASRTSAD